MTSTLKKVLIFGGIGAVLYGVYSFYKKQIGLLQNYDYQIIGAKVNKLSLNQISFSTKVRFFNKSKIEVVVQNIYLDVYIEDTLTGFVTENKPFVVPSQGSSDIDLDMTFNPQSLLKNLTNVILVGLKKKDLNFTLKGYANIRSGFVSTTLPITYSDVISAYV
jgi:LEA14-like dessication related protein